MDEELVIPRAEAERLWPLHRGHCSRSLSNRLFGSLLAAYDRIDALEDEIGRHNATEATT